MEIAVLGATGTIGRLITKRLDAAGHTVRPISRGAGFDVRHPADVQRALAGADAVVDGLNIETMSGRKAVAFFSETAGNVVAAAGPAGVRRIVCVSIAGAADPTVNRRLGYYRGKAAQEAVYCAAATPVTIIHSTQWYELVAQLVRRVGIGPIAVLPTMRMAAVAADRVAALVCREVAADGEQTRAIQAARGSIEGRRLKVITELPLLGGVLAGGGLIPAEAIVDDMTLQQWLHGEEGSAAQ